MHYFQFEQIKRTRGRNAWLTSTLAFMDLKAGQICRPTGIPLETIYFLTGSFPLSHFELNNYSMIISTS